jgi:hypothetical protein
LAIHESGWLVYRFKNVDDKLVVLANGPYLIYGRPLIIKAMPEYFDFGTDKMSCVPVWVKFPNLPLKYWSPRCLSKIASKLGTPIQSDQLTFNMSRISYVRVLVELDLLANLKSSIVINLPNGSTLNQPVIYIYETLPRFCKLCKVLGHNTGTCTSPPALAVARPLEKESHPSIVTNKSRNVFDRLGPVAEPSLGKAKGQIGEASHSYDPMTIEVAVASGDGKLSKERKQGNLLAYQWEPHTQLIRFQPSPLEVKHLLSHLQKVFATLIVTPPSSIMGKNQLEQSHAGKFLM